MIKLTDILKEIKPPSPSRIYKLMSPPENVYNDENNEDQPDKKDSEVDDENDEDNGFKLKNTTINPHTGTSTSDVEYNYELNDIRKHLNAYNRSIKPLRYSQNADIASLSINIAKDMKNLSDKVKSLEKLIDIYKK